MCKLYSITTNQTAIATLFRVINRYVGNLPPMPAHLPTPRRSHLSWGRTLGLNTEPLGNGDEVSQRLNLHFFHDLFPVRLDRVLGAAQFARDTSDRAFPRSGSQNLGERSAVNVVAG